MFAAATIIIHNKLDKLMQHAVSWQTCCKQI